MKCFLSLSLLGVFCTESVTSYITSISPGGATPPWTTKTYKQPPTNIEVDDVFREEYLAWAKRYGKETNDFRFENFKLNYMLQMQHNKKTGTFNDLNEFGDLTAKEFETGKVEDKFEPKVTPASEYCVEEVEEEKPEEKIEEEPENFVEVELVDSIPSLHPIDSGRIPRKTQFSDTTPRSPPNYSSSRSSRRRPEKINVDYTQSRSYSNYANPGNRQRPEKINVDYTRPSSPSNYANPSNRQRAEKVNINWSSSQPRDASSQEKRYSRYQRSAAYDPLDPNRPRVTRQDQPRPNPPRRKRRYVRVGPDPII